jgi:hypothetical protein
MRPTGQAGPGRPELDTGNRRKRRIWLPAALPWIILDVGSRFAAGGTGTGTGTGAGAGAGWRLPVRSRRIAARFAEVVCPPGVRTGGRADRVAGEFELMLTAIPSVARRALLAAFGVFDRAARVYPPARGRRFSRLGDQVAERYVRALLARGTGLGGVTRRLKGLIVMCYYELPDVKDEIGYRPGPYIAAVSQRRLERYGEQIQAGEAAVLGDDRDRDPDPDPGDAR